MHIRIPLLLLCLSFVTLTGWAQDIRYTEISAGQYDKSPEQITQMADIWALELKDMTRYLDYMRGEGRYFYAHLDPVMVLGIIETDPEKQARYAIQYLMAERERVRQQLQFTRMVEAAQRRLFPADRLFDFSQLPQAKNSPGYLKAIGQSRTPQAFNPINPPTQAPIAWAKTVLPMTGDVIDLLIAPDCLHVCFEKLAQALKSDVTQINLYARDFADREAMVAWLQQWEQAYPAQVNASDRIDLKRDDPLVFKARARVPSLLLRREGLVIAQQP